VVSVSVCPLCLFDFYAVDVLKESKFLPELLVSIILVTCIFNHQLLSPVCLELYVILEHHVLYIHIIL
jgi:hypothetical protein